MSEIIENFKVSLIEDGKSPKTVESYVGDIKAFKEFIETKVLNIKLFDASVITLFDVKNEYILQNIQ